MCVVVRVAFGVVVWHTFYFGFWGLRLCTFDMTLRLLLFVFAFLSADCWPLFITVVPELMW